MPSAPWSLPVKSERIEILQKWTLEKFQVAIKRVKLRMCQKRDIHFTFSIHTHIT